MIVQVASLFAAIALSGCAAAPSNNLPAAANQTVAEQPLANEPAAGESELVAVEFSGSRQSLDRLAGEVVRLGWRVDTDGAAGLRILPPPNYEPSQFGALLERIDALGLRDIGLRLIGPNGPVGPEG